MDGSHPKLALHHRIWLGLVFVIGFAYIVATPPFQGADEGTHWSHLWSVARGEISCRTNPGAAQAVMDLFSPYQGPNLPKRKLGIADYELARKFMGDAKPYPSGGSACVYPPIPYVLPAIAARLVGLRPNGASYPGSMLNALYAARLVNWLLVTVTFYWLLRRVYWSRTLLLLFYSIPMVLSQSVAVSTDPFLFAMGFLLAGLVLQPARWSRVAWMVPIVFAMTLVKPIYAPLALLAAPAIGRLRPTWSRLEHALIVVGLLVPSYAWKLWYRFNTYDKRWDFVPTWGVDPAKQTAFLKQHPKLLLINLWEQFKQFFGDGVLSGSWKSVLGLFGYTEFYMSSVAYCLILLALLLALVSDTANGIAPPRVGSINRTRSRISWVLAICGVVLVFPLSGLAMYMTFTTVGGVGILGIQGRYYLLPFLLLLVLAVYGAKRRWTSQLARPDLSLPASIVSGLLMLSASPFALTAMREYWYR